LVFIPDGRSRATEGMRVKVDARLSGGEYELVRGAERMSRFVVVDK